jgi:hypothetical protein
MLPDDALLEVFNFYVELSEDEDIEAWITLVHVCQQWRCIVFTSPRCLNLQLLCTRYRPVRKMLGVWPALPIAVRDDYFGDLQMEDVDNIVAALEHNDRIYVIDLWSDLDIERHAAKLSVMHVPFPTLKILSMQTYRGTVPVLPDSFLGGSAPRLQSFYLCGIPFLGLPKLLLTTTDLVKLTLWRIPHNGYISPSAMVTCLSSLIRLQSLILGFRSPLSRPDRGHRRPRPPPLTRTVLPALTYLMFRGISEYLEDLVMRIDTPHLHQIDITFFNQLIFDTPRLRQFLGHTEELESPDTAHVIFDSLGVQVRLSLPFGEGFKPVDDNDDGRLLLRIFCRELDWQLSSVAQVCNSSLPLFSTLEDLYVHESSYSATQFQVDYDMENMQWLELFHPFTTVKNLYLTNESALLVVPALQELARESITEELPALQNIFLENLQPPAPIQEAISQFVAARQLSGHPIVIHSWERWENVRRVDDR